MRLHIGTRWESIADRRGTLEVYLDRYDLWVGVFVGSHAVYVCPLPCLVLRFSRGRRVLTDWRFMDPSGRWSS